MNDAALRRRSQRQEPRASCCSSPAARFLAIAIAYGAWWFV